MNRAPRGLTLMEKIEFYSEVRPGSLHTPDHVWLGALNPYVPHGMMRVGPRMVQVHRVAWCELVGPIPEGFDLHHECDCPACWWPEHLEVIEHGAHSSLHAAERRARRAA